MLNAAAISRARFYQQISLNAVPDTGINLRNGWPVTKAPRLQVVPRAPVPTATPPFEPPDAAKIPGIVLEIASAVADAHAITTADVMAGTGEIETRARRIAAALSVRRAYLTRQEIAKEFGIHEGVVTAALAALDPILIESGISVTRAWLKSVVDIIVAAWARYDIPSRTIPLPDIIDAVALVFKVSKQDIKSARRTATIVKPRMVAMALGRRLTLRSLPDIGRYFGGRDHTTVLHSCRKMQWAIDEIEPRMKPDSLPIDWARAMLGVVNAR